MEPVYVARTPREKALQRALLQWKRPDKRALVIEALREAGIAYAIDQISDLVAAGVDGIHLYTMNNPAVARQISDSVSAIRRV